MRDRIFKQFIALTLCVILGLSGSVFAMAEDSSGYGEETTYSDEESEDDIYYEESEDNDVENQEVAAEDANIIDSEAEDAAVNDSESTSEEDTEKSTVDTPAAKKSASAGAADETVYTESLQYEDDDVKVLVGAEEGIIPEDVTLKVVPVLADDEETEDQYKEVEEKLQEKAEDEEYDIAGFLAYDISFVDEDGNKVEPNGEVKVSIDYKKAAIPESVKDQDTENLDVTVMHLEENKKGEVKKVVDLSEDEKIETLKTTENQEVEKAEFKADSFSSFTITWKYKKTGSGGPSGGSSNTTDYFGVTVKYVNENGTDITASDLSNLSYTASTSSDSKTYTFGDYAKDIDGYQYTGKIYYSSLGGSEVASVTFSGQTATFKNKAGEDVAKLTYSTQKQTAKIYLVYKEVYTICYYKNAKNTGGKDTLLYKEIVTVDESVEEAQRMATATLSAATEALDGVVNDRTEIDGNITYRFYGWSNTSDANGTATGWVYSSDKADFSVAELFENRNLNLYAIWGFTPNTTGSSYVTQFALRLDGSIPNEPSSPSATLYEGKITGTVTDAVKEYRHIYNDSDAVKANIADGKEPTASELASAINASTKMGGLEVEVYSESERTVKVTKSNVSVTNSTTGYAQFEENEILYVEWYVLKCEGDGWHIDGALKSKKQWNLKYDSNCSTAVSNIIDTKQYKLTDAATVHNTQGSSGTQIDTVPTRTGYVFTGWNTKPDGTGDSYTAGDSIGPGEAGETITLYAQWSNGKASLTLQKKDTYGNTLTGAKFKLDDKKYVLDDGSKTIKEIELNTVHSLTEVKAPVGYTTRDETIYFKITKNEESDASDGSDAYAVTYYTDKDGTTIINIDWITESITATNITLTVENEAVTRNVSITKMWDDDNDITGERPTSLDVALVAKTESGETIGDLSATATLTSGTNWKHTWYGLPAYYAGEKIVYSAAENEADIDSMFVYEQVQDETETEEESIIEDGAASVLVSRVAASMKSIAQNFGGNNMSSTSYSKYGSSTTSVDHIDIATNLTATVVINGKETSQTFTIDEEDAKYISIVGKNSTGTVYESSSASSTSTSTDSSGNSQIRLSGTFPVGSLSDPVYYTVTLNKTIQVTVDGTTYDVPVTVSFTTYYWESTNTCPGLSNSTTNWKNGSVISGSGIDASFGTVTGSAGKDGTITVQKTISGVTLTEDKTFTFDIYDSTGSLYKMVDVTVTAGNTTAVTMITGVPEGTYSVKEESNGVAISGYSCDTATPEEQTISSSNKNAYFNVVNTYTDKSFTVSVNKVWSGDGESDGVRPDSVKATVYFSDGTKSVITLNETEDWSWTSSNITKTIVDIREDMTQAIGDDGKTLADYYTSSETIATDGKSATITNTMKEIENPDTEETEPEETDPEDTDEPDDPDVVAADEYLYLTNRLQYEDITLTKIWDDSSDTSHRPTNVQVFLKIKNNTTGEITSYGTYYITNDNSSQVNGKTVWSRTIRNLPKLASGYSYVMTENWSNEYYADPVYSEDGLTVTNTLNQRDVKVVKIWDDANNAFNTRPESITVNLLNAENEIVETTTLNEDNGWRYTFTALSLNENYSVTEEEVNEGDLNGYTATYTEDSTILAITNSLEINWVLKKVSATNPNVTLAGAEFTLTGLGENAGKSKMLTTGADGTIEVGNFIVNGTARLEETKAPAGYSISETTWDITFTDGVITDIVDTGSDKLTHAKWEFGTDDDGVVTAVVMIEDDVVYSLPSAGGSGIYWYIISGMLLMMAGTLILYKRKCREVLGG